MLHVIKTTTYRQPTTHSEHVHGAYSLLTSPHTVEIANVFFDALHSQRICTRDEDRKPLNSAFIVFFVIPYRGDVQMHFAIRDKHVHTIKAANYSV